MGCNHHSCLNIVPLFQNLEPHQLAAVSAISHEHSYKGGELIYRPGEPHGSLIVVHTGAVKLYRLDSEGNEQVIRILSAGEFAGELALLGGEEDGLALIREIVRKVPLYLEDGGSLLIECDWRQHEVVLNLLEERGFSALESYSDLAPLRRVVGGTYRV